MLKKVCLITASLLWSFPLAGQSRPSAEGPGISVWVGASISTFNPDYGCSNGSPFSCWNHQLIGITPYAHTKPFLFQRIGAEGEARFLHWHGPEGMSQQSYLAGPRIYLIRYKRLIFNGKFMLGAAHLTLPPTAAGEGTYFVYAPGLDLDYRLARRIALHADYEFQSWPSFKGTGTGQGGLTPNGLSVGVSYAILQ